MDGNTHLCFYIAQNWPRLLKTQAPSGRDAEFDEDEVPLSKAPLSREYTSRQLRNPSGYAYAYAYHRSCPDACIVGTSFVRSSASPEMPHECISYVTECVMSCCTHHIHGNGVHKLMHIA